MGDLNVTGGANSEELRKFTKQLLTDVRAMELMLEQKLFETAVLVPNKSFL